jgi:diguanylate cyclase (GGDEF)-like protein
MVLATTETPAAGGTGLEASVRGRLGSLSYLPTTVAVAMKFVELGKNPEADPGDYAKVISSDSSLSSKLLSLANSSWFGVRNKVTKPHIAVNLLGLGTIRTLAMSYCLTGLHNELHLSSEESKMFWSASLCKAVAARQYATRFDSKAADEAFAVGLFEDFALPVMYAVDRQVVGELLQDSSLSGQAHVQRERELFNLDHAEAGRILAQKLGLPELFVDAVAFHHQRSRLKELTDRTILADAAHVASLLPHALNAWNQQDAEELRMFLAQAKPQAIDADEFLAGVQKEFDQLMAYFEPGDAPRISLVELLECATKEVADHTTRLMGTVHEMLQQAASAGREVEQLLKQHNQLEQAATRDGLTGVLNREGFKERVSEVLARAARYRSGVAVIFMDLDHFKMLNDRFGHACGDEALQAVADTISSGVRQSDLVGRLGGDEFVVVLSGCSEDVAAEIASRLVQAVGAQTLKNAPVARLSISAGLLWVPPEGVGRPLDKLLSAADELMYEAKRQGGGRLCRGTMDLGATKC